MTLPTFILALVGTSVSAIAQLLLKAGTNALSQSQESHSISSTAFRVITQPFIVGGVICYGVSMVVWLAVLSRLPVSVAYPLLSIGYIITAIMGYALFGEQLGWLKIAGILIIIFGVVLLTSAPTQ